jgi:hypothetical protein
MPKKKPNAQRSEGSITMLSEKQNKGKRNTRKDPGVYFFTDNSESPGEESHSDCQSDNFEEYSPPDSEGFVSEFSEFDSATR